MKVLMVCLGNICRSPLAAGILNKKAGERKINMICDSCGTGGWHSGEPADKRSADIARINQVDISGHRARQFDRRDFDRYDMIYAMDTDNFADIISLAKNENDRKKVKLIMNEVYPGMNRSVPDPYYGGDDGFKKVFDMLSAACDKILQNQTGPP